MLLSLCVLSIVKARYCATPFGKAEDQLQEQMNASIRMETEESPARTPGEEEEDEEKEEVLIQVVPFGGLEWLTSVTFKEPAADMEVSYMDYEVKLEESSLIDQYPRNHQVLTDPYAVHKQGWDALKAAYLDKQNIRMDLDRFKSALREAMSRLP